LKASGGESWLAIDVGGANLKAADGRGFAACRPFALWRAPERLEGELRQLIDQSPACSRIAATMTGELADCFATKAEGVSSIVDALVTAAEGRRVLVYATYGRFLSPEATKEIPIAVAASNWHALASFAARYTHSKPALLIDVGSTTTDVIPLDECGPATSGQSDSDRLLSGELVYTGVERTAVSAIVSAIPWRGRMCPVASELFATSVDAYLLLGLISEDLQTSDTADGRAWTMTAAHARMARMICADATMYTIEDARLAAEAVCQAQVRQIAVAIDGVVSQMNRKPETVVLSGHGEFLARFALEKANISAKAPEVLSLNKALGPHVSRCAPAHALAILAREQM
jgi:probable H4MPT-linked C1 transfer pathway protein